MEKLDIFEKYFNEVNLVGVPFINDIWIRSNRYYVFFGEEHQMGKTYVMFSKKYFLTIELTKEKKFSKILEEISNVVEEFRKNRNLKVEKYSFWLPHCLVNGNEIKTQLVAESFGVSRELALEYLRQYDKVFDSVYNTFKKTYFGLPLLSSYEEANSFELKDNTHAYLKGIKLVNKKIKSLN